MNNDWSGPFRCTLRRSMTRPVITLTTDFGLSDHFVGVMKGVIAGIEPAAQVIDISHGIQPYDIADGAFTIAQAYRHFPRKTIHVVVVDPGRALLSRSRQPDISRPRRFFSRRRAFGGWSNACEIRQAH
jgi:hypothetical protein